MNHPHIDLKPEEEIIWNAPIDTQIMNGINYRSRLIYGSLAGAMLLLALYMLILFANGFWGVTENVRTSRLIATVITGPAVLIALVALWAFVERFRLTGSHTMPSHYFVTNQRAISTRDNGEIFDEVDVSEISHTQIDGQGQTQLLMLARSNDESDTDEARKPPFLFVHLEDLQAVKALVDGFLPTEP